MILPWDDLSCRGWLVDASASSRGGKKTACRRHTLEKVRRDLNGHLWLPTPVTVGGCGRWSRKLLPAASQDQGQGV